MRSSRREEWGSELDANQWMMLVYGDRFSPKACFHLEVHWLVCTGAAVEDFVQQLNRKAKQCQLQLVQVPENSRMADVDTQPALNPFRPPVRLSVTCPVQARALEAHATDAAAHVFNFVVDGGPSASGRFAGRAPHRYRQYMHASLPIHLRFIEPAVKPGPTAGGSSGGPSGSGSQSWRRSAHRGGSAGKQPAAADSVQPQRPLEASVLFMCEPSAAEREVRQVFRSLERLCDAAAAAHAAVQLAVQRALELAHRRSAAAELAAAAECVFEN